MPPICKVLIVEDYGEIRELLAGLFEAEGYEFATVADGAGMRAALAEDDYDIVVVDVALPGREDGFELAEAARAQGCGVILTTGDHRHVERLAACGHHHLLKPFPMGALLDLAEKVLKETENTCVRRHPHGEPQAPASL
jgi:DNA-binding response OmpR family regulator